MTTPLAPQAVIKEMAEEMHKALFRDHWARPDGIEAKLYQQAMQDALSAAKDMGWVFVPVEKTDNMLAALHWAKFGYTLRQEGRGWQDVPLMVPAEFERLAAADGEG